MNLEELNAKIEALVTADEREEARYLRDERLGMLCGSGTPTDEDIDTVALQLFPLL